MAAGREELQAVVTAQDKASAVFTRVDKNAEKMSKGVSKSLGGIKVAAVAAVAAIVGMGRSLMNTSQEIDRIAKSAKALGTTTSELSALQFAAEQSGAGIAAIESGWRRLTRVLADAESGLEAAQRPLRRLGLDAKELQGLGMENTFKVIADRISAIEDPMLRAATAQEIFGRNGVALLPLLLSQSDGIGKLTGQAREMGIVLDDVAAEKIQAFNDKMNVMDKRLTKAKEATLEFVADSVEGWSRIMRAIDMAREAKKRYLAEKHAKEEDDEFAREYKRMFGSPMPDPKEDERQWAEAKRRAAELDAIEAQATDRVIARNLKVKKALEDTTAARKGVAQFAKEAWADIELAEEDLSVTIGSTTREILDQDMATREAAQSQFEWAQAHAESKARMEASAATGKKWIDTLTKINEGLAKSRAKVRKAAAKERQQAERDEIRAMELEFQHLAFTAGSVFETVMGRFLDQIEEGRIKLQEIGRLLARTLASVALRSASEGFGGAFASIFSAQGNVFSGGRVQAFASGGVINSPMMFPLRGGAGIAGEAGPEAIMPLKRDSSGRLGVGSEGGGGATLNVSIHAVDARSIEQMAAENQEAFAAAVINVVGQRPEVRNALRANLS